jgi:hypothetical protein
MGTNPYQASDTSDPLFALKANEKPWQVDGRYVVIKSGVSLPAYCVKTGEPVSPVECETQSLTWTPPWTGFLKFPLSSAANQVLKQQCELRIGLSRKARLKALKWFLSWGALALLLVGSIFVKGVIDNTLLLGCIVTAILVAGFLALHTAHVVSVAKYKQGLFWIAGCSPAYLERLKSLAKETP